MPAKAAYQLCRADLECSLSDCLVLLPLAPDTAGDAIGLAGRPLCRPGLAGGRIVARRARCRRLQASARRRAAGCPRLASGDVHMHVRGRRALQDVLSAIRLNTPVAALRHARLPNGERHLRRPDELAMRTVSGGPARETLKVAARCRFSLDELHYAYPDDVTPAGFSPRHLPAPSDRAGHPAALAAWLPGACGCTDRARAGADRRAALRGLFLTVWDIVRYARAHPVPGRGSAANSAVCYCLGITEVDPARMNLLFERFISRERNEPPDIDVDFDTSAARR